jgi:hypothetical protein
MAKQDEETACLGIPRIMGGSAIFGKKIKYFILSSTLYSVLAVSDLNP